MSVPRRLVGLLLASWTLWACQQQDRAAIAGAEDRGAEPGPIAVAMTLDGPDWDSAYDCRAMLALLQEGLAKGRIGDLAGTPFALIDSGRLSAPGSWSGAPGLTGAGLSQPSPDTRCIIRVDRAVDRQSEHQVLSRESVRSRYKSGTRSEKNPAYEVAKVRLRQAEKAAKPGKSSLMKIDDPLMNLVGTLVGGALAGFGQWGAGDQLEEALDTLMATPPRIERPKYKSYQYELKHVRASREAEIPVMLTDRSLSQSWEVSFKRRERRTFAVASGLDRQDEDYARARQENMTEQDFQQWLAASPSLALTDIVTGLLDRPSTIPVDRLALLEPGRGGGNAGQFASDASLDAAALPAFRSIKAEGDAAERLPSGSGSAVSRLPAASPSDGPFPADGPFLKSHANIIGEALRAEGVFVAPHFVLAPSEVVGDRGLVDIEDQPGHAALGLVAAIDRSLGLALIQSPMPGLPIATKGIDRPSGVHSPPALLLSNEAEEASLPRSPDDKPSISRPRLVDGRLAGFRMASGPDIDGEAIRRFLARQQHLMPAGG